MTQRLGALAAFLKAASSVPSIHIRQLAVTCNSSSRGSNLLEYTNPDVHAHE